MGLFALSPMLFMLAVFAILSLFMGGVSNVPIVIVFILTCTYSLFALKGRKIEERIKVLSSGAGDTNLLYMIWIFVMAGSFASAAKGMGAVEAMVALSLEYMPAEFLLSGIFLASALISLCIGTSVGTVVALVPIVSGMSSVLGISLPVMVASVTGGAFFGDNLSFISDTTIVATRSQHCRMKDKFRTNFYIALPAALITFVIYAVIGFKMEISAETVAAQDFVPTTGGIWRLVPYLWVLVAALLGGNVLVILLIGTTLCGIIGILQGAYDFSGFVNSVCSGAGGMGELIIVSLLAGGVLAVIKHNGGIDWLIDIITKRVKSKRGAKFSIALMVGLTNLCTANNTIAILSVGGLAHDLSKRYAIEGRRTASILDTFSCVVQGMIPYGAQLLIAGALAGISSSAILPYLFYPVILGFYASLAMLLKGND